MGTERRAEWNTPIGSVWEHIDPAGRIRAVRVVTKFQTTEGWHASLRDPDTDAALGNAPITELGVRL